MKSRELTRWREQQFLSQTQLAELLNVHRNTVGRWERDVTDVPGWLELALEAIAQTRATQVRRMRAVKEERAHRLRLKMIHQHPERYASLVENARKARAAKAKAG